MTKDKCTADQIEFSEFEALISSEEFVGLDRLTASEPYASKLPEKDEVLYTIDALISEAAQDNDQIRIASLKRIASFILKVTA